MSRKSPKRKRYGVRSTADGGRIVVDPDDTVSLVGPPDRNGIKVTGVLNEPFASLLRDPGNVDAFVRAGVRMDTTQKERIHRLHAKLTARRGPH